MPHILNPIPILVSYPQPHNTKYIHVSVSCPQTHTIPVSGRRVYPKLDGELESPLLVSVLLGAVVNVSNAYT